MVHKNLKNHQKSGIAEGMAFWKNDKIINIRKKVVSLKDTEQPFPYSLQEVSRRLAISMV